MFFVLVVCCRLSATSLKLLAFVCFSQFISAGANVHVVLEETVPYPIAASLAKIIFTLFGFWNFALYCLTFVLNTLQTLALDYAVAFYHLLSIKQEYFMVQH